MLFFSVVFVVLEAAAITFSTFPYAVAVVINMAAIAAVIINLFIVSSSTFYINLSCDHPHPASVSVSTCFFWCEFDYIFALIKSIFYSQILLDDFIIASVDTSIRGLDSPLYSSPALTVMSG